MYGALCPSVLLFSLSKTLIFSLSRSCWTSGSLSSGPVLHCQSNSSFTHNSSTVPLSLFGPLSPSKACSPRLHPAPTIIDHSESSFILIGANPPAVSPCTAFLQTLRGAFTPPYPPFLACLGFSFLAIYCFFVREDRLKSPGTTPSTIFSDSLGGAVVQPIFRALPKWLFLTAKKFKGFCLLWCWTLTLATLHIIDNPLSLSLLMIATL